MKQVKLLRKMGAYKTNHSTKRLGQQASRHKQQNPLNVAKSLLQFIQNQMQGQIPNNVN